jgi:branched-chain amino acid transport system permease protein
VSRRLALPRGTLARHLLLAALGAAAVFVLTSSASAFANYRFSQIGYFLIAAAGLTVLTGLNGQLSLGHGGLMAIGAYTAGLMLKHGSAPLLGVLALSVVTATLVGVVVGISAARLRGPYLAGITLALALALPDLATKYSGTFGGEQGLPINPLTPPSSLGGTFPPERWLAWISLAAAIVTLVLLANLRRSRRGRLWRAVRDDEIASALAGIHVARTQVGAFIVSSACAGLAGSLLAYWAGLVAPSQFDIALSLQLVTAIVIGGLGTLSGAVWGASLLVYLPAWSDDLGKALSLSSEVKDNLPLAVYGAALVAAMLAFPHGIQGALSRIWRRVRPPEEREGRGEEDVYEATEVVSDSAPSGAIESAQMEGDRSER